MNKLKKNVTLVILCIGTFFCMLDTTIMTIVLPEIESGLNASLDQLSWAVNLYTIIFASITLILGRMAEIKGQNRYMMYGLVLFTVGSICSGISHSLSFLYFGRIVQSIGAAITLPLATTIGLASVDVEKRNKIIAVLGGVQGLAAAVGPTIGGWISEYYGWRWVFFINVPFLIITIIILPFVMSLKKETGKVKEKEHLDFLGAILSMSMMFTLTLALIKGEDWHWNSTAIISLFIISAMSLVLFIAVENKVKVPMIDMELFKSRNFNAASLTLILCNFFLGGFAILMPTYLVKAEGLSELHAAIAILPYSIAVFLFVVLASLMMKKVNTKLMIIIGFISIFSSYFLIGNMYSDWKEKLFWACILLGFGYGVIAGPANVFAAADFKGKLLTASQSVANVLRQTGLVLAVAIFMSILTSNATTARKNVLNYGLSQVSSTSLSSKIKDKMDKKLHSKLDESGSKATSFSNNSIKVKQVKISQSERDEIINKLTNQKLINLCKQKNIPVNKLPLNEKKVLTDKITAAVTPVVNKQIDQKERRINTDIQSIVSKVHHRAKKEIKKAFLNVYKWIAPMALISILPVFIFKKKQTSY